MESTKALDSDNGAFLQKSYRCIEGAFFAVNFAFCSLHFALRIADFLLDAALLDPLAIAAEHTGRIQIGTSISVAFARNPMTTAQLGWDLQTYSGGRFILGLGTQIQPHIEKLDLRAIDVKKIDPRYVIDVGVGHKAWSTLLSYSTRKYTKGDHPKTCAPHVK